MAPHIQIIRIPLIDAQSYQDVMVALIFLSLSYRSPDAESTVVSYLPREYMGNVVTIIDLFVSTDMSKFQLSTRASTQVYMS